jgi:diguanylate cyclase (GGDEF)-like protein
MIMSLTYCERYHFDSSKIEERLQWLRLDAADYEIAAQLQQTIIEPHVTEIIDTFYAWLTKLDAAREILVDDDLIAHLRVTQQAYLLTLGVDFTNQEYFESRLRVGQAHVWVGLSLSLYQCAYRYLGQLILDHIDLQQKNAAELTRFVHKIIALDMSLAIETYHLAQVDSLEESLGRAKTQQLRLRMAARIDSLTGLSNHETIMAELKEALKQSPPPELVVAMVDIDFFKKVNDTYGHLVGDKVLTEVSMRMRAALRGVDSIGRYGGEEFMLLIYGASLEVARQVAERVRKHVAIEPINLQGLEIPVTLSLGLSKAQPGEAPDVLIARADEALYRAKSAGRNQIQISSA